jgi:hypothetical protein
MLFLVVQQQKTFLDVFEAFLEFFPEVMVEGDELGQRFFEGGSEFFESSLGFSFETDELFDEDFDVVVFVDDLFFD